MDKREKSPHPAITQELERLRRELKSHERPNLVDVAIVEALASSEVQSLLSPILEDGANFHRVRLEDSIPRFNVACLVFDLTWPAESSHVSPPPSVAVLVEFQPMRVLKAAPHSSREGLNVEAIVTPTGPTPVGLTGLFVQSPEHADELSAAARARVNTFIAGLKQTDDTDAIPRMLPPGWLPIFLPVDGGGGGGGGGGGSGGGAQTNIWTRIGLFGVRLDQIVIDPP